VAAWEWLDSQMNSLVPLEVVIPIEALDACVTFEGAVIMRRRRLLHMVW